MRLLVLVAIVSGIGLGRPEPGARPHAEPGLPSASAGSPTRHLHVGAGLARADAHAQDPSARTARPDARAQRPPGSLRGRVDIKRPAAGAERRPGVAELGASAPRDLPDLRRAVVYLETAPRGAFEEREPERGRIDQRNETFSPHVLPVTVGAVVDFPNNDSTYHNVFSLSKPKRFDLGRYARGRSKSVRFDRPGVVRVFCDIHSHMSAYVLVLNHSFYATTAADGRYGIDGIPPGTYAVSAWYEGEARDTRTVTIPAGGGAVDLDFAIP